MKQFTLFTILITICSVVFSQVNKGTTSNEITVVSSEEKAAIKKMVRLDGSKVVAQPGYTFRKGDQNTVVLLDNSGGVTGKFRCGCKGSNGSCGVLIRETEIYCTSSPGSSCTTCIMYTEIFGGLVAMSSIFKNP